MAQLYSIKLRIQTDDTSLDKTIAKIKKLESNKIIKKRVLVDTRETGKRGSPFNNNMNRFSSTWFGNMFSISGIARNASNAISLFGGALSKTIGDLSKAGGDLSKYVRPIAKVRYILKKVRSELSGFPSAITNLGKGMMGSKFITMASTAIPLVAGTMMLGSESMGQAGSNLMMRDFARKGLGGSFGKAQDEATRLAEEFGFDRASTLGNINVLTGLKPGSGDTKFSMDDAVRMAGIIGKIGLSNPQADLSKVSLNIQQLLGEPTPSKIDLRELVGQAPVFNKIAKDLMALKGVEGGDHLAWMKESTQNILDTLYTFDEMISTHPVMKARGQIKLAKQDFWMTLAEDLTPYWSKVADANKKMYDWLGDQIVGFVSNIDVDSIDTKLDQLIIDLTNFASALGTIASGIVSIANSVNLGTKGVKNFLGSSGLTPWNPDSFIPKHKLVFDDKGQASFILDTITKDNPLIEGEERIQIGDRYKPTYVRGFGYRGTELEQQQHDKGISDILFSRQTYENTRSPLGKEITDSIYNYVKSLGIPSDSISSLSQKAINNIYDNPRNYYDVNIGNRTKALHTNATVAERFGLNLKVGAVKEAVSSVLGSSLSISNNNNTGSKVQTDLEDLSKGAKSLIINFNAPIVEMDVNVDQVDNISDLWENDLKIKVEDTMIQGLSIAFNNATGIR